MILISIDTLRSDRLPAYGYAEGKTPALDRLRSDATLFEHAYSPVPLTLPAHVSLFTGLLPPRHGVRDNVGYAVPDHLTSWLPTLLSRAGYRTGAGVSAYPLGHEVGFGGSFDFFADRESYAPEDGPAGLERPGDETLDAVLPWLREAAASGDPFFLFFHLYEPHHPYAPPEPWASELEDPYDGEIAHADAIVGRLLDALRELGVYEGALIVVLSDHGEGLGDHGEQEHGLLLYREAVQVPLLVKWPEGLEAPSTSEEPAQLTDLVPTVMGLLGLEVPEELDGVDLRRLQAPGEGEDDPRPIYGETFYPRIHLGWSELVSVIEDGHQYIEATSADPTAPDSAPELFDLGADPAQVSDRFADDRRRSAHFRQRAAAYDSSFAGPAAASEEERAALASLGYLAGQGGDSSGEDLPHPRTRVAAFEHLKTANSAFARGDFEAAAEHYRGAVDVDPELVSAWLDLGRSLARLGRLEAAVAPLARAAELANDPYDAASEGLEVLRRLNRPAPALELLGRAIDRRPADGRLRILRGRTLALLGRADAALADAEVAVRLAGSDAGPGVELGAEAHHLRGGLRAGRGELEAAEADFRRALELDSEHAATLGDLAVLVAQKGELEEARRLLRRAVDSRPDDARARANLERLEAALAAGGTGG